MGRRDTTNYSIDENIGCPKEILAAVKHVNFRNRPIIGFHWNSFMDRGQIIRFGRDITLCEFKGVKQQTEIYNYNN